MKKVIVVILLLVICIYFGYKGFNLHRYNTKNIDNYEEAIAGIKIVNSITIKNEKLEDDEYLTIENIKVRNDFSEFKQFDEPSKYFMSEELNAIFLIVKDDSYVNLFKGDSTFFSAEEKEIFNTAFSEISEIFEENNINNDIELFKYLEKTKDVKNNVFTSVKQMKRNYLIQSLVSSTMPKIEGITLINGDYMGYILYPKDDSVKDLKQVCILKDNKRYGFSFINLDYFTDEYIEEIISTIVIE